MIPMAGATLSIAVARSRLLPGESLAPSLLLENPTTDDLLLPLPATEWWAGTRLTLTRPDGSQTSISLGTAQNNTERLTLYEESGLEAPFTLDGVAKDLRSPGWYELHGVLPTTEGDWAIAPSRWYVEPVLPMEVCLEPQRIGSEEEPQRYWQIVRGTERAALYSGTLAVADFSSSEAVIVGAAGWRANIGRGARSLTTVIDNPASAAWVAWLEESTLHAGTIFSLFNAAYVPLPDVPARILPHLLPQIDGGVEVWVLSAASLALWRVRFAQPVSVPPPSAGEDPLDAFPDPRSLVRIATSPVSAFTTPSSVSKSPTAAAVTQWNGLTVIAMLTPLKSMVEVHYGVVHGNGILWGSARIDEAELLPDTDPVVTLDDRGIGRVGVLFRTGDCLGVAALAFDHEAQPLWSSGIRRTVIPDLPAVQNGAISLILDPQTDRWGCSWAVTTADGNFLVSGADGSASPVFVPGSVLGHTTLAAWPGTVAAAYQTEQGTLAFASARDTRNHGDVQAGRKEQPITGLEDRLHMGVESG